jgi:hypothetical protein
MFHAILRFHVYAVLLKFGQRAQNLVPKLFSYEVKNCYTLGACDKYKNTTNQKNGMQKKEYLGRGIGTSLACYYSKGQ